MLQTSLVSKNCIDTNHEGNVSEKQLCNFGGQQLCDLFLHTAILEAHSCFRECFRRLQALNPEMNLPQVYRH